MAEDTEKLRELLFVVHKEEYMEEYKSRAGRHKIIYNYTGEFDAWVPATMQFRHSDAAHPLQAGGCHAATGCGHGQ